MRLRAARRAGLSLMEVLVALAIFLMALTALTYLVNTSSSMAGDAQRRARAAQLARAKINEMAAGALPLESRPDGSFEDEEPDLNQPSDLQYYRWSAEVSEGAAPGLHNVSVTVIYRPDDPFPLKVTMSRIILDPAVTGSTQDIPAVPDESATESGSSSSDSSGSGASSGGSSTPAASGGASASSGGSSGGSSGAAKSGGSSGGSSTGAAKSGGSGMGSAGAGKSGGGSSGAPSGGNSGGGPSGGGATGGGAKSSGGGMGMGGGATGGGSKGR